MSARTAALAILVASGFASGAVAADAHKAKGSAASADNSADQLNATSLNDAKNNTPYTPAAPASDAKTTAKKPAAKKS